MRSLERTIRLIQRRKEAGFHPCSIGKANLEKSDLEPALKSQKDRLMTKNVAAEIAEKLCESVAASLKGKRLASFTRISLTVQIPIFEKGYEKDPAIVAKEAIQEASRSGFVVVLVDTVGRMQV